MASDCEVQIKDKIYVFASSAMAGAFNACTLKKMFDQCLLDYPPVEICNVSAKQIDNELDPDEDGDLAGVPIKRQRPQ
jgi:hypothetical protein